jgi:hypothetical protein
MCMANESHEIIIVSEHWKSSKKVCTVPTPCASTLHHTRSDQTSCTYFCSGCRPFLVEYQPLKSVPPHPSSLPTSLVTLLACNLQHGKSDPAWELRSNIPRCTLDSSTRRAAKRSMSLSTYSWRLPESAPGCPLLSIWRASLPRPRCVCQGQGQITDHPFFYRKIIFGIDVMFWGYCVAIVVFLFPALIPAFWTISITLMMCYCFLCFLLSLDTNFSNFVCVYFKVNLQANSQCRDVCSCAALGLCSDTIPFAGTLPNAWPECAAEIDRRECSKPQLAKMVRNMNLWLNDFQMVLADQMPLTNAAQTKSERPAAPGGNNSPTGFAPPARDISNVQTGLQNMDVVLHFHGSL